MQPQQITDELLASNVRGRGGAGFAMGRKVSFMPAGTMDKYLVCNADESEPGTFKDRELMEKDPHLLIEGMIISAYALRCRTTFIYIRGEMVLAAKVLADAIGEALRRFLGENVFGSKFSTDMSLHRGAGAYICGEETALIESLEGKRAPRD